SEADLSASQLAIAARNADKSELDVLLEPGDVGALPIPAARSLHDDGDISGSDDLSEGVGSHLTFAEVGGPVGAGIEGIPRVVGVDQVDAAGNSFDPINETDQFLATGMGVAGVEAESDGVAALRLTDRIPESLNALQAACHGIVAAARGLDEQRNPP